LILYPFRYLWWLLTSLRRSLSRPPDYGILILENPLPALPQAPGPFWQRFVSQRGLSLKELSDQLDLVARDPRTRGVVLHLRPVAMPMAMLQDIRELIAGVRARGKRVVAWAPFYNTSTYYLATACDEILMMPLGMVNPLGFATTGMYLAEGLARLGVEADFIQVSPFKSAADMLTKSKMTPEVREQLTWLLDSHHKDLIAGIVESRTVDATAAQELIDASPYPDEAALEKHVVDGIMGEEQLPQHLAGGGAAVKVGTWEQLLRRVHRPRPRLGRGPYIAVLSIEGTIVDGRSGGLPVKPPIDLPLVGEERAGDLSVVPTARLVAADKRAAAAVLYINSRGGSATASEAMRQALALIGARKPLVVAMGPFAGSGGYWVAMPAKWIIARSGTLTGSIGVLTGKLVTSGVFSKLRFNRETIAFGKHFTLESDERPYTKDERRIIEAEVDRIYNRFIDVVSSSRGLDRDHVVAIAGGRVWTGRQALERKLVDEIGGLEAAVRKARSLAGLGDDVPARQVHPAKKQVAPRELPSPAAFLTYAIESLELLRRAPALAVMDWLGGDRL
jgi:protease-4